MIWGDYLSKTEEMQHKCHAVGHSSSLRTVHHQCLLQDRCHISGAVHNTCTDKASDCQISMIEKNIWEQRTTQDGKIKMY